MFAKKAQILTIGEASAPEAVRDMQVSSSPGPGPGPQSVSGANVLLTDEHYKHTLGIVRHLGSLGANVSIVAASRTSLACSSRFCQSVILSDGPSVRALVETVIRAVQQRQFDLVMPVSYPITLALALQRTRLAHYTRLELVDSSSIERAADKAKMLELAGQLGVPAPRSFRAAEVFQRLPEIRFPVVIKPQQESPGRGPIRYARDLAELRTLLPGAQSVESDGLLVQEFIPGTGCGFFATYQNGVCKRIFMHRRVREYPARGGVSTCAESFYDARLEKHGRQILDALGWHGVAMVEFRRDSRDGEYKLMEVNPKFWGSLDLALACGADFPGDLCQMALGRTLHFSDRYKRDLRFHWPISGHGDLFHLWTRPHSFLDVALDFLNPSVKSNVFPGDLAPNLLELRRLTSRVLQRKRVRENKS